MYWMLCHDDVSENATAQHFYALLDGLMSIGHSRVLELPSSVVIKVFRALEFGLLGDEVLACSLPRSVETASHVTVCAPDSAWQPLGRDSFTYLLFQRVSLGAVQQGFWH